MNFDVAVMNPPYDKGMHIDILNIVKKFVNNIVNISPIDKMQYALTFNKEFSIIFFANTHSFCTYASIVPQEI